MNGFLSNQKKYNYKLLIKREKPYFLKQPFLIGEWYKFVPQLGLFEFKNGSNNFFFCVDRCDHSSNYMNEGYLIPIIEKVKYYFKANYNAIAIDNDPTIKKFRDKIIPIGLSFPLQLENKIKFMPQIFPGNKDNWTYKDPIDRLNLMLRNPRLSYLKHLRKIEPNLNLFFVLPYYTNQKILNEYRLEVMRAIEDLVKTKVILGFASRKKLPEKYQHFKQPRYEMRTYYRQLARSKVTVYLRGPHNGISSKLGELLALGKPIIGQPIHNNQEIYYQNQFFNEQFGFEEPKEIAKNVHELLQHPKKAASYAKANANTFDTKFSPEITVSHIIEKLLT